MTHLRDRQLIIFSQLVTFFQSSPADLRRNGGNGGEEDRDAWAVRAKHRLRSGMPSSIANGETATASKWSAIRAALSKISGFGKAIGSNFAVFKAWWDGLEWWQKLPVNAIAPGLTAIDIWNALH
ncbi:hypothetical protein PV721_29830 [Streptomyces sp. MB09-01]|uniref:hypothetical protein n=1 Tax=Streptomyces sp. MB09-01 TaxID=3028666 RepID=UPI0029A160C9|nr:hypothetical protein [Streptomyces sp. MB09-01]MDX3538473.1 hypothetical protein [Streptomyces sp. MB09-01]